MIKLPENNIQIINKLETKGEAYLIGGAVRDLLLNLVPKDYDIATNLRAKEVLELFPQGKYVGKSFGVVLVDGVEIATYRRDHYDKLDGKNCKVEFVSTIEEDLARRDFTMNAMAYHPERGLIDPFRGKEALNREEIEFVGNPRERIKEDYCRILRLIRFCSTLGFHYSSQTVLQIGWMESLISLVSSERIRLELLKMMEGKHLFKALNSPFCLDVFKIVFPAYSICQEVTQNKYHMDDVWNHLNLSADAVSPKYPLLRLAALFHDIGKLPTKELIKGEYHFYNHEYYSIKLARKMLKDLTFSNDEINYICEVIKWHMFFVDLDKNGNMKKYIRRLQSKLKYCTVRDIIRMRLADRKGNRAKLGIPFHLKQLICDLRAVEREDNAVSLKDLAINGNDLLKYLPLSPGPIIGILLKECLAQVIENPELNTFGYLLGYCSEEIGGAKV
jgi:putative nucleotidyltransferase with HDIG domain